MDYLKRKLMQQPHAFIKNHHPCANLKPTLANFINYLSKDWIAQAKINGRRLQVHINADENVDLIFYTRHGTLHTTKIDNDIIEFFKKHYKPTKGWNVIEGELILKPQMVYLFDFIMHEDITLNNMFYLERYKLLNEFRHADNFCLKVGTLEIITDANFCWSVMNNGNKYVEGLVFKSPSAGFADTTIIRCKKSDLMR
jgi:ATP-dependent DNA ligase